MTEIREEVPIEWIEVFPFGISVGGSRPILIFKDKDKKESLPVWLHPVDAGLATIISDGTLLPYSSHQATSKILELLKIKVSRCLFVDLIGHYHYVDLVLEGTLNHQIRLRADSVMSFCLYFKTKFYCTKDIIEKTKELEIEIAGIEQGIKVDSGILERNHPYLN